MVKASNSWLLPQHNNWQPPNFDGMSTSIEPVEPGCLPTCVSPGTFTFSTNIALPRIGIPNIPNLKTQQISGAQGLPQISVPTFQNLLPARNPYLKENISALSCGFAREAVPNAISEGQRGFVIFDQSVNETRLIYSSFSPTALKPTIASRKPTVGYLHNEEHADKMERINLTVPKLQEVSDENLLSGEEGEMREDTDEINALLDSDDGYDYEDDDSDDDEVSSTGHSPILIRSYGMRGQVEEISDAVADSDGQNKRQKLLDGGYKRSSQGDLASSEKVAGVHSYEDDDVESSYVIGQNQEEDIFAILGDKEFKKDKVCGTLKILEGIIPGAKNKDPLLVLDLAIDYLKSLKLSAKTLGVNFS